MTNQKPNSAAVHMSSTAIDDLADRMRQSFQQRGVHVPDFDEDPRATIGMMDVAIAEHVSTRAVAKGLCAGCNHS